MNIWLFMIFDLDAGEVQFIMPGSSSELQIELDPTFGQLDDISDDSYPEWRPQILVELLEVRVFELKEWSRLDTLAATGSCPRLTPHGPETNLSWLLASPLRSRFCAHLAANEIVH